jgi:hypothetical protein
MSLCSARPLRAARASGRTVSDEAPGASLAGAPPIDPLVAEFRELLGSVAGLNGRLEDVDAWYLRRRSDLHASDDQAFRDAVQHVLAAVWSSLHGHMSGDEARARLGELERQLARRYG